MYDWSFIVADWSACVIERAIPGYGESTTQLVSKKSKHVKPCLIAALNIRKYHQSTFHSRLGNPLGYNSIPTRRQQQRQTGIRRLYTKLDKSGMVKDLEVWI